MKTFAADKHPRKGDHRPTVQIGSNRQYCPHGKIVNALIDKTRGQQAGRLFSQ